MRKLTDLSQYELQIDELNNVINCNLGYCKICMLIAIPYSNKHRYEKNICNSLYDYITGNFL